jgi:hypothetical protein
MLNFSMFCVLPSVLFWEVFLEGYKSVYFLNQTLRLGDSILCYLCHLLLSYLHIRGNNDLV